MIKKWRLQNPEWRKMEEFVKEACWIMNVEACWNQVVCEKKILSVDEKNLFLKMIKNNCDEFEWLGSDTTMVIERLGTQLTSYTVEMERFRFDTTMAIERLRDEFLMQLRVFLFLLIEKGIRLFSFDWETQLALSFLFKFIFIVL